MSAERNSADDDRIAARQAEALQLRVRGKTIREIAAALQVSVGQAHADLQAAKRSYAKQAEEDVQAERGLDLSRLERALKVVEDVLCEPEPERGPGEEPLEHEDAIETSRELKLKALDRLVKIQEQRAKLLGLYAPERRELEAKVAAVALEDLDAMKAAALANECDDSLPSSDENSRNST